MKFGTMELGIMKPLYVRKGELHRGERRLRYAPHGMFFLTALVARGFYGSISLASRNIRVRAKFKIWGVKVFY